MARWRAIIRWVNWSRSWSSLATASTSCPKWLTVAGATNSSSAMQLRATTRAWRPAMMASLRSADRFSSGLLSSAARSRISERAMYAASSAFNAAMQRA